MMNAAPAPLFPGAIESRVPPAPAGGPSLDSLTPWPVAILGIPFDPVTPRAAIERIEGMIASRRPHYVVAPDVELLFQAHRDADLYRALLAADLTLCNDTALVWASRCLGNALPCAAGAQLMPMLLQMAAEKGHRIFFLGASPAVKRLRERHPTLQLTGDYAPPFAARLEMEHEEIARRIHDARPDILLVALGAPTQEKWIATHYAALGVPVTMGLSAQCEFAGGKRNGARLPVRDRAAALLRFVPLVVAQGWHLAPHRAAGISPSASTLPRRDWCAISPGENLTRSSFDEHSTFWREMTARNAHCMLDLSGVVHLDSTGVGFLLHWQRRLRAQHRQLVLLAPDDGLRHALDVLGLSEHFVIARDAAEASAHAEATAAQNPAPRQAVTRSLAWCGEIIAANADDVWRMTTDHLRAFASGGATLVIIDLARLRFIDCAGADLMVRLLKWAHALPVQILFLRAEDRVRNVLQLSQLDQLLLESSQ